MSTSLDLLMRFYYSIDPSNDLWFAAIIIIFSAKLRFMPDGLGLVVSPAQDDIREFYPLLSGMAKTLIVMVAVPTAFSVSVNFIVTMWCLPSKGLLDNDRQSCHQSRRMNRSIQGQDPLHVPCPTIPRFLPLGAYWGEWDRYYRI
jgi:hypothetical protein